jgi:deoxyribonuclease-4
MILGAHVSVAGGPANAFANAAEIGADSVQIFVKPPRKLRGVKPFTAEQVQAWEQALAASKVEELVVHANYLINLAGEAHTAEYSREALLDELLRCSLLGIPRLVVHPGQHLGAGVDKGLANIAQGLRWCLQKGRDADDVVVCLENMAGQGSMVGYQLEHLRTIADLVEEPERIGFCLDTCHTFASGHDLRSPEAYAKTMEHVDRVLGLDNVRVVHLNDSKADFGSRVDRHEEIGKGKLGSGAFWNLVHDERLRDVPGVLETPHDENKGYAKDLKRLRKLEAEARPAKAGLDKFA